MATNAEIRDKNNSMLFKLLKIEKENIGIKVKGLSESILEAKAVMSQEEVAYVEKLVAEL
ncbi:MAG: hypothetical protein FWG83_00315 [Oscillospiraceae bacterium]|nr:hypothetical protein [Oscillospiraceae bacterium]